MKLSFRGVRGFAREPGIQSGSVWIPDWRCAPSGMTIIDCASIVITAASIKINITMYG